MKAKVRTLIGALAALAFAATAQATTVHVEVTGVVDYNVLRGDLGSVPSGAPVTMGFNVDSNVYLDSPNYPTRGYNIDLASFNMSFGGMAVPIDNPQPFGSAYFVLRNDDPAVDGFFLSQGDVDFPRSVAIHVPGVTQQHELDFSRTFDTDTVLTSLNILDAQGTYGFEHMESYLWTIGVGAPGAEVIYQSITIAAVPEPAPFALIGLGGLVVAARARKARAG
jgi:hypothetical protein